MEYFFIFANGKKQSSESPETFNKYKMDVFIPIKDKKVNIFTS